METTINKEIHAVLHKFGERYFLDGQLNKQKVINDLDHYAIDLIAEILANEKLKDNFTININGNIVVQTNKLIELFELDEYLQDSYTKFSKKIGLTTNGKYLDEFTDVVLDFPYKDAVLKASMSKEDTDQNDLRQHEPFLNEVIAKEEIDVLFNEKIFVNVKKFDVTGVRAADRMEPEDNLLIKGNNLLALHTLKNRFRSQVKSIIIDPPYYFKKRKDKDSFQYNSNFKLSSWLVFMKNRLEVSRELLSEDGFIVIIVGVDGYAHLKLLADEVFQVENDTRNYIGTITWRKTDNQTNIGEFANVIDYILIYRKSSKAKLNRLPLTEKAKQEYAYEDEKGKYRRANILDHTRGRYVYEIVTPDGTVLNGPWMITKEEYETLKKNNEIHWPKKGKQIPYGKTYLQDALENGQITSDFWDGSYGTNQRSADEIKTLFGSRVFDFAKPEKLLMNLISLTSNKGDIILDYFMGSATTQAVAHKMGRRYIGIEQMDYIESVSVERLRKVIDGEQGGISQEVGWQGGGSFIYAEIMEKNCGLLTKIIEAQKKEHVQEVFRFMLEEADIDFKVDLEKVKDHLHNLALDEQKRTLIKIIDKNQLYYNYIEIDDENVRDLISYEDYAFNKSFYGR